MRINRKTYGNLFIILSFLLISYIGISIMLYYHFIPGAYDQLLHINRIAEIRESISHLVLPQFGYNYLHGSAIMTLYPYINLMPIVFLSFLIKSKILLVYISFSFYIFITLLISFYSSIGLSKSWHVSYLFAIIYSMSLMYIDYTFITADLGEAAALTWLPLIIFGFVKLIRYKTKWIELSIGLSLMIGTHILSSVIIIALLIFWFVININKINWTIIINIGKATILSLLTTAIIWLPLISFMINNPSFTRPESTKIWDFAIPLSFLIKDSLIGRATEGIGIFAIIEIIMGLMFYRHFDRFEKQMYIISIIIMIFCSTLFPWHYVPSIFLNFFNQFQFTTRFYIIPQLMLNYLFANTLIKITQERKTKNCLLIIICLIVVGFQLRQQQQIMSINNTSEPFTNIYSALDNQSKDGKSEKINKIRLNLTSLSYKITNNKEYNNILNANNVPTNNDYWPSSQTKDLSSIVGTNRFLINNEKRYITKHNEIDYEDNIYKSSNSFILNRIGFNKFKYYNPKKSRSEILLPIFYYHGERFKAYDNNKPININENSGMMSIKNFKKGNHVINIQPLPSYNFDTGKKLTLIGLFGYIISMFVFLFKIVFKKKK